MAKDDYDVVVYRVLVYLYGFILSCFPPLVKVKLRYRLLFPAYPA